MATQRDIRFRAKFRQDQGHDPAPYWLELEPGDPINLPNQERLSPWHEFTGQTLPGSQDKSGEIWEGDVIRSEEEDADVIGVVEMFRGLWCVRRKDGEYINRYPLMGYFDYVPTRKVIGNIHWDPQLMPA